MTQWREGYFITSKGILPIDYTYAINFFDLDVNAIFILEIIRETR